MMPKYEFYDYKKYQKYDDIQIGPVDYVIFYNYLYQNGINDEFFSIV
jgi:hypothetical protein